MSHCRSVASTRWIKTLVFLWPQWHLMEGSHLLSVWFKQSVLAALVYIHKVLLYH